MANFTPPLTATQQPDEMAGCDDTGNLKKSFSWKGPYTDLETAGKGIAKGDVVASGWVASSWSVRRTPGDYGVLTIECTPPDPTSGSGSSTVVEPLKDIWSIKSVRNDVSIMAYCGSGENEPNRALIEAWMKEPDGELAKKHQFKKPDGEIVQLTVGFIDTPPAPAGTAKKPTGIGAAVTAHQWLKVQDDAQEQPDGKWTRTESWMGIAKSDSTDNSPWDADLYGANRWPMPYNHQRDTANPGT